MSEWLGKPKVRPEELPEYWRRRPGAVRHFVDNQKPRLYLTLELEDYMKFEQAVQKRYGSTSVFKIAEAGVEAIKKWSEDILKE